MTSKEPADKMTDLLSQSFTPSPDAVENRVGTETVILHLGNSSFYGLDPVGTIIWEMLKSGSPVPDIRDALVARFSVEPARIEDDMRTFLADLLAQDIVVAA